MNYKNNKWNKKPNSRGGEGRRFEKPSSPDSYWLYGKHPVIMALQNPSRKIRKVLCTKNSHDFLIEKISKEKLNNLKIEIMDPDKIDRIIGSRDAVTHQGLAAEVEPLEQIELEALVDHKLLVATDKITDPHNLGAIMRSCAAFGAGAIITQDRNSPPENATIAKISAGSIEVIPYLRVNSLWQALDFLKEYDFKVIGLDGEATKFINEIANKEKVILVIGSEGKGLSESIVERCDEIVKIDIAGSIESLNASVAAAVALYEVARK